MRARSTAVFLLILAIIALIASPVAAGAGGKCEADSCRECVSVGCGWIAEKLECKTKGIFGFGKGVTSDVSQCTPLRDALVKLGDNAPALSQKMVAAYDFIREQITVKD